MTRAAPDEPQQAETRTRESLLRALHDYAIELTSLSSSDDLFALVTRRLREVLGARLVGISTYDERTRELVLRHTTLTADESRGFVRFLGRRVEGLRFKVSPQTYARIMAEVIGDAGSLGETTFGAISGSVETAIVGVLGIDRFVGLSLQHRGALLGTVVVATARGVRRPENDELRAFAAVTSNALRRWFVERDRAASEARFREFAENLRDVLVEFSPSLVLTYASASVRAVLGYTPEEVGGRPLWEFLGPGEERAIRDVIAARRRTSADARTETIALETALRHRDGSVVRVEVVAAPVVDAHGSVIGYQGSVRDVAARWRAEEALRHSEERYRGLFERVTDGIFVVDERGRVLEANAAACAQVGYGREEVVGLVLEALAPRTAPEGTEVVTVRLPRKDGVLLPVELSRSPMEFEGRRAVLALSRDVSERVRSEEERRRLEGQLQHSLKLESIGRLAGGVAHDFNNLLTAIAGQVELGLEQAPEGTPMRETLDEIGAAAARAATLTRQLLAFSRKQQAEPRTVGLDALVLGMKRMLERVIGEDVRLETSVAPGTWPVHVDPGLLEQAIVNLAVNARDAMPEGGRLAIDATNVVLDAGDARGVTRAGEWVRVSARDTGEGMSAAVKAHLFEPFFTTKPLGKGTGLGLAGVYGMVTQAAGWIDVASEPGKGTTFELFFPRAKGVVEEREPAKPKGSTRGHERVLLVEDEAAVRRLATRMLSSAGYVVTAAGSPDEALAIVREASEPFAILVTDVVMPGMNGRKLAELIARDRPSLRVLFTSGYSEGALGSDGTLDAGIAFVAKPYTLEVLTAKVREVLDAEPRG